MTGIELGAENRYSKSFTLRPPPLRDGQRRFVVTKASFDRNDEAVLILRLVCDRRLFGMAYQSLMPDVYNALGRGGGVMIRGLVSTPELFAAEDTAGDIDLLVIPFQGNELMLSKALAIEIKAVRPTFRRQGKSPNEFGFSQASRLLDLGFPNVAVGHLIVSDRSPSTHWREVITTEIVDADIGECSDFRPVSADMMPGDLIRRTFGRLKVNCAADELGLLAAYVSHAEYWFPNGRPARGNSKASRRTMDAIANYYENRVAGFVETLKYPPEGQRLVQLSTSR